jgi:hypothetical protein
MLRDWFWDGMYSEAGAAALLETDEAGAGFDGGGTGEAVEADVDKCLAICAVRWWVEILPDGVLDGGRTVRVQALGRKERGVTAAGEVGWRAE